MPSKVAVVIPVYKEELNEFEKISLAQCKKVLGKYPIIFVAPADKNFSYFTQGNFVIYFPPQFFQSTRTYSTLLMSPQFYEMFKDFEYILIYQLDAFVFYDALEDFCSLGYDYIGAPLPTWSPWFRNIRKDISFVGNGGFSLRNVQAHYNVVVNHKEWAIQLQMLNHEEDTFFSYCGKREDCNFNVAPYDVACKFSAEVNPKRVIQKNGGKLPFGCHAWFKYGADLYMPIFQQLGYNLIPLKDKMSNGTYEKTLRAGLLDEAMKRLNRRLNRGQSLMRYLPRNHFASIRVVRSPFAMMIFVRLLLENPNLADEICLYDENEQDILIDNLRLKKEPHLIINFIGGGGYDENLISAATNRGIKYGIRVVSFMREYLTYCEKAFHNLGKS